ncbi:MAG TPA: TonB family protein [Geobacteraceae bacterium]
MDAFIDREFQDLSAPVRAFRHRDFFGKMVAISLALHVISSLVLLSPRRGAMTGPPVSYLDLKDMKFPEQAAPAPTPARAEETDKAVTQKQPAEQPEAPLPSPAKPLPETAKLENDVKQSLANAEKNPEALQERSFGLGLTNGYFSSIAEGETLRGDIREYYFAMLRQINEKWWLNKESQQGSLRGALINIVVARDGRVMQMVLVRSSGNPAFDRAIVKTIETASPLPPLPQSYEMGYFTAPLRFRGPLDLLAS